MSNVTNANKPSPEDAPKRLEEDLRALYGRAVDVPAEIDKRILLMARERISRRRPRFRVIRWAGIAAAAAVLLAVVFSLDRQRSPSTLPGATLAAAKEDFDGSGSVDILDAFALEREIKDGGVIDAAWDLSGDGLVDGSDVNLIAMAAVSLDTGGLEI